ncbi:MAG: CbiX/SirB N-terminal domain-containing protein [Sulfurovum sp.]|uniref:sirohydrochlorin chelatase n=1 Tax=Sulfurovum sp. TaxID=1969726 RepID=UPI0028680370|nr:CbiX/SirB N-terminal domain-containing protein [Sulfurovum sp.]MCO4845119.1 CbiX/SirB N-terminal domain-containing protein [Sulfurovum sp.]
MPDNALIIIAHGSRKESSNAEVMALGVKVNPLVDAQYDIVKTAFLEFAEPSLEVSITTCIEEGVTHIVILPYFLASGNHVTRDIPAVVEQMEIMYPEVKIELKEHLGSAKGMISLLSSMAL